MALDRYLIAPEEVGFENDIKPWLLPDSGYEQMNNAYIFRGRIRKRFGSQYMTPVTIPAAGYEQYASRLRVNIGTTSIAGFISSALNPLPGIVFEIGQIFTIGNTVFTSWQINGQMLRSDGSVFAATFNTTTGDYSISNALANTDVYWYPALPVMGLPSFETKTINLEPTIAFDTEFAYQYTTTGWERLALEADVGAATWTGNDSQFFWAYTYQGVNSSENYFFVTNFNAAEPNFMRYLDTNFTWHNFDPIYDITFNNAAPPTNISSVISCRIIVGFHDHLVLLNTVENDAVLGNGLNFQNRARYCAIGSPLDILLPNPNATPAGSYLPWIDNTDNPAFIGGGYVDNLQTQEEIVSARFLKDRLIVGYTRSTWELVYTGNQQTPFVWQQIDPVFGSQSPFSGIEMNTTVLEVSQNGYTACSGATVERIDQKIPDEVFKIRYINNGNLRVQGIRDFKVEQVYWSIPSASIGIQEVTNTYPNQVLVYNYRMRTWAYNTDCFTCFGYFTGYPGATWGNTIEQWQFMTATWADGSLQPNAPQILGGNQEGFVVVLDADLTRNAGALQITNATSSGSDITLTIENHNLNAVDIYTNQDEYILIENIKGATGVGYWTSLNGGIFPIIAITQNTVTIVAYPIVDPNPYVGGGTVARVSNLNILSKQWNPYNKSGQNVFIQKMNFLVDRTGGLDINNVPFGGAVQVDYYPSTSKMSTLSSSAVGQLISNGIMTTAPYDPVFYPLEQYQDRVWRPQYLACDGNAIQIRITMNDQQIVNPSIALVDFQLHAVALECMATSVRIGG